MKESVLHSYQKDTSLGMGLDLLISIKSFDQQAIRERYLAAKKRGGKLGSVERRAVSLGGIVKAQLAAEGLQFEVLSKLLEPRGVGPRGAAMAFSSEKVVYVLFEEQLYKIENPWFAYIHKVEFHPENIEHILISSSGFDCLFEYNWKSGKLIREWFAWEHGMNQGKDKTTGEPVFLCRSESIAKALQEEGKQVKYISDPENQVLPTAMRAAFINSVSYDAKQPEKWLATFFHEGTVRRIHEDGSSEPVLDGMKNPHGGMRHQEEFLAVSTGTGEIHLGKLQERRVISIAELPGKPEGLEDMEWLQNIISYNELLLAIDSNRNQLIVLDPEKKLYNSFSYPLNWAAQDLVVHSCTSFQEEELKHLSLEPTD